MKLENIDFTLRQHVLSTCIVAQLIDLKKCIEYENRMRTQVFIKQIFLKRPHLNSVIFSAEELQQKFDYKNSGSGGDGTFYINGQRFTQTVSVPHNNNSKPIRQQKHGGKDIQFSGNNNRFMFVYWLLCLLNAVACSQARPFFCAPPSGARNEIQSIIFSVCLHTTSMTNRAVIKRTIDVN